MNRRSDKSESRRHVLGLLAGMAVLGTSAAQTPAPQRIWMTVGVAAMAAIGLGLAAFLMIGRQKPSVKQSDAPSVAGKSGSSRPDPGTP